MFANVTLQRELTESVTVGIERVARAGRRANVTIPADCDVLIDIEKAIANGWGDKVAAQNQRRGWWPE